MDDNEMNHIAAEIFWQFMQTRITFPGAYEYITAEMDLTDEELDEAYERMFGESAPSAEDNEPLYSGKSME
jgi:hypothetical protein